MKYEALRKKFIANGVKIIIIVSALIFTTYAWLTRGTLLEVGEITMATEAVNTVLLSIDGGTTWETTLSLNLAENFVFNNEVTGDGVSLFRATEKEEDGTPLSFTSAQANVDYLEFDVIFKAAIATDIFLEKDSAIVPEVGVLANDLVGPNVTIRKSYFGDFSRDLIAATIRTSFTPHNYADGAFTRGNTTSLVWAPNPNYEISEANGTYTADINSSSYQVYNYLAISGNTPTGVVSTPRVKDLIKADFYETSAHGDPMLLSINNFNEEDKTYRGAMTVRMWVEGNDRDALTGLKGGIFRSSFVFVGLSKETNPLIPTVSANTVTNTINDFDATMEYSLNSGLTWQTDLGHVFNNFATVIVRYKETSETYASDYITLNF